MKKTGTTRFEDFPAAKLYIEDIKEIVNIIESSCEKVTIRTGDFDEVLPSEIDDLVTSLNKKRFDDIFISAYSPYVSVDLRSYGVSAYIGEDELVQHGIVSKIREILEKRKKKYFGSVVNALGYLPMVGFGAALTRGEWGLAGIFIALSFLMIGPIVKYQMSQKVVMLTSSVNEKESFLTRRKDELLVASISALIGALVSFILIKYFGQA